MSKRRRADLRVGPPETVAAGLKAVEVSTAFALSEVGPCAPRRCWPSSTRRPVSTAPAARGPKLPIAAAPSSARTAPRRRRRRPPSRPSAPTSSPVTRWPISSQRTDHWLEARGPRSQDQADVPETRCHALHPSWEHAIGLLGGALRELPDPNRAVFYTPAARATKLPFSTSSSPGGWAPTTCRTARTCATSPPAWP